MAGCAMLIFLTWSSLSPIVVKVLTVQYSDLALHLIAYGSLTFWFQQIYRGNKNLLLVAITLFGYGLLMEAAQGLLTTTRDANLLDVIANTTGVILGSIASRWFAPHGLFYLLENLLFKNRQN